MTIELLPEVEPKENTVQQAQHFSIMFPFEPKMSSPREINNTIQSVLIKVEQMLTQQYAAIPQLWNSVKKMVKQLNFETFRKSVAIFVSPEESKVYYLDIPVKESIAVGDHFKLSESLVSAKEDPKYLLLSLQDQQVVFYEGSSRKIRRIAFYNINDSCIMNDTGENTSTKTLATRLLTYADMQLSALMAAYPFPLFITGAPAALIQFKRITQHADAVYRFIPTMVGALALHKVVSKYIADWNRVREENVILHLENSRKTGSLIKGFTAVQSAVKHKRGKVMFIEQQSGSQALDEILEDFIKNGGSIEILRKGSLSRYEGIAMIDQ